LNPQVAKQISAHVLPETYRLRVEPISVSKAKLLKFFHTKSFFAHQPLEISFLFENIGGERFPGGIFSWHIDWPSGQSVHENCEIPALEKNEKRGCKPYPTHALSEGFGLIFITDLPSVPNGFVILRAGANEYKSYPDLQNAIGSVLAKRTQETYTFYGLTISAIGLLITALDRFIALLK
jgi:hypothetical protein